MNSLAHRTFAAFALGVLLASSPANANPPPWDRTEVREPCADFNTFRNPYFGDTHVHTKYSADAIVGDIQTDPRDAYRFALGEPMPLPPFGAGGKPTSVARLRRPLDFTAVTDHAEHFGEIDICLTPNAAGFSSPECVVFRAGIGGTEPLPPPGQPPAILAFFAPYTGVPKPSRFEFCGPDESNCRASASLVWQDTREAAEEYYDRSRACTFTSFVAYEWTGSPLGTQQHRNVIFRNEQAPELPITYLEQQSAEGLWRALEAECLEAPGKCDVLAIPHNSNLSFGLIFAPENADRSPFTAADAAFRAAMEPLVEITQHKGDSECMPGVLTSDEQCGFEKLRRNFIVGPSVPAERFEPLSFVRNALKEGLVQEQRIGVNPFKLGLVGSTDTHSGTPGAVREDEYTGHLGDRDSSPEFLLSPYPLGGIEGNPGGLAVVWAEENSRDALFAAMRRREVYGTSGTRPIVRFFAGRLPRNLCNGGAFAENGYRRGVPMGGELGPIAGGRSPRFAVLAAMDPGTPGLPGTPLQRIQIVKGWVDSNGTAHEKVFEVAGDPDNGASVDVDTCETSGAGYDSLCALWEDPEFDRNERAFYYARVLENPTCRWSTLLCNKLGVDCAAPDSVPEPYATCCDPGIARTIQERAWTSPIWYRPEGVARLNSRLHFGPVAGADVLRLVVKFGARSPEIDPKSQDLTVRVRDDDEIWSVTIPAGTLQQKGNRWKLHDPAGSLGGLRRAVLTFMRGGAVRLAVQTVPMDLSRADRTDHMVEVDVKMGAFEISQQGLWSANDGLGLKSPP